MPLPPAGTVVCLIADYFFVSKVDAPLRQLGLEPIFVDTPVEFLAAARRTNPVLTIIDLALRGEDPIAAIEQLRADEETKGLQVLCFGNHANVAMIAKANLAGADEYVTAGQFSAHLPTIVSKYLDS